MSSLDSCRNALHQRFREAFGEPHAAAGGGARWSLPPLRMTATPVNVIITGWSGTAGVWVFDPHDVKSGVEHTLISDVGQIDALIERIRGRVHPKHFANLERIAARASSRAAARPPTTYTDRSDPKPHETEKQNYLRARFREAFGEPHHTMGHDDHWRLESSPTLTLNVLVNGSPEKPAVWVFEPQTLDIGVMSRSITTHAHIEEAVAQIQQRLKSPPPARTA